MNVEIKSRYDDGEHYTCHKYEQNANFQMLDPQNNSLFVNVVLGVATLGLNFMIGGQVQKLIIGIDDYRASKQDPDVRQIVRNDMIKRVAIIALAVGLVTAAALVTGVAVGALAYYAFFAAAPVATVTYGTCRVLLPSAVLGARALV